MIETQSRFVLPLLEWANIPARTVALSGIDDLFAITSFKISRYPITNAQFDAFIQDGGYKNEVWWQGLAQAGGVPRPSDWKEPDNPKLEVCWYEAMGFCRWLSHQM